MTKKIVQLWSIMLLSVGFITGLYAQNKESKVTGVAGSDSVVFAKDLPSVLYPDIPDFFYPSTINYTIKDGLSGVILDSLEAKSLASQLTSYAKFYQAPWYFKDFSIVLDNKLNFTVKYFAQQSQFQDTLVALTGDASLQKRNDFITILEADGTVVLYIYQIEDPIRMQHLLKRQGFIQFATIALPTLPVLLRDGFAVYFEDIDLSHDVRAIIRNRTYYKNMTDIPNLYTKNSNNDMNASDFVLSDDQLYAWLIINYLYNGYDFMSNDLPNKSWEFQYFLMELSYDFSDSATLLTTIQENNRFLAERLEHLFDKSIQQRLTNHLATVNNHHQAYLAGVQAFENHDLAQAKQFFIESALSLSEYYQPRYAIARTALYQIDALLLVKTRLESELERATEVEKAGYQLEIQVVNNQINQLMEEAKHYFEEARVLIEYFLAYHVLSASNRQELEEFRGRIVNFYRDNTSLSPYSASEALPDDTSEADRLE